MPKFNLSAYPCVTTPDGTVQTVITDCLGRDTVECTVADLQRVLADFAAKQGPARSGAEHPDVYASAAPAGRAPNGWKLIEAQNKNSSILYRPAAKVTA
jgi:hypothetical protein